MSTPALTFPPHHRLSLRAPAGTLQLAVDLSLHAPWTVVYGPSGSGKSSILRACCGLLPNASVLFERFASPAAWTPLSDLPPRRRCLGYAPQAAALLPHLNVRDNVLFAAASRPRDPAYRALAADVLTLFALDPLAGRFPSQLSGGEAQRVNLARACAVPDARLLLVDEPFAGADRSRRDELLAALLPWLVARCLPVLSVTHDVDEALLLDADIVRLHDGAVAARGPAREVLAQERARLLQTLGATPAVDPQSRRP